MKEKSNVINLSVHQYPAIDRLALRSGLLAFHGDDYRLLDEYSRVASHWSIFRGAKVLVNFHLTSMTLMLLDTLLAVGAQVYFMVASPLVIHGESMGDYDALTPLQRSGIPQVLGGVMPKTWGSIKWDLMIDCAGKLYQHVQTERLQRPRKGIIELTASLYPPSVNTPIISLDGCEAKRQEVEEAGESFVRALAHVWVKQVLRLNDMERLSGEHEAPWSDVSFEQFRFAEAFKGRFVIFGFGRLGKSIAQGLLRAGLEPHKLVIVDKHRGVIEQARQLLPLSDCVVLRSTDCPREVLGDRMSDVFCAVACTGVKYAMASLPLSLFDSVKYFCNMGVYNEWHDEIPPLRFLAGVKHSLNLILATPISPVVLSLLMYTLLRSAEYALDRRRSLPAGMLPVPPFLEEEIRQNWLEYRDKYSASQQECYSLDHMDQAVSQVIHLLTQRSLPPPLASLSVKKESESEKALSQAALLRHFGFHLNSSAH